MWVYTYVGWGEKTFLPRKTVLLSGMQYKTHVHRRYNKPHANKTTKGKYNKPHASKAKYRGGGYL